MKALFILSIVVPVGLLTTFRLTGILQERITVKETTTLETVRWEFQRPNHTVTLDKTLRSKYSGSEMSTTTTVRIWEYHAGGLFSDDLVTILVSTNLTTTLPNSFVESVHIVVDVDNQSSIGWLITDGISHDAENLSLTSYGWSHEGSRAYVNLKGITQPKSAYFSAETCWILRTSNNQTHHLAIAYELIYFNGTTYKKTIQPFQLKILGS